MTCTALLITRDLIARADFATGSRVRPAGFWRQTRPAVEDFPSLVEAALRLGPRRVGRVWVLSSEIWTQTLGLPMETVAGLAGEELDRLLAFEAEPFSGIGAFDSRLAHVELPAELDQRRFWLTQILASHLDQIEYVVEQARGRLAGVGHPGGLPRLVTQAAGQKTAYRRVELWPDAVIAVQAGSGQPLAVHVLNTDPKGEQWKTEVEQRLGAVPPDATCETLRGAAAVAVPDTDDAHVIDLDDQLQLEGWLQAWAEHLDQKATEAPLVRPPKRPLSAGRRRAMAIFLSLFAVAICVGHYLFVQNQRQSTAARTEELTQPKTELDGLNKQYEEQVEARDGLKADVDTRRQDLARFEGVLAAQRQRFARLLAALADDGGDGLLVQKIDGAGDEVAIHGVCLTPDLANGLVSALAQAVGPLGWQVELADKKAQLLRADGSPWAFEIRLHEKANWQPPPAPETGLLAESRRKARDR